MYHQHDRSDSILYNESEFLDEDPLLKPTSLKTLSGDSWAPAVYEDSSADQIRHAEKSMQRLKDGVHSTDGWRTALEHKSGVKVFVRDGLAPGEKSSVFKAEKIIQGFSPKSVFSVVAVRNLWDEWFVEGNLVDNLNNTTSLTYMVMKGILGTKERDLSLVEKLEQTSDGSVYFVSSSVNTPRVPRQPNRIRAVIHLHGLVMEKLTREDGSPSTKLTYLLMADAKGWVPGPVAKKLMAQRPLVINAIDDYLQKFGPPAAISERISYFHARGSAKGSVASLTSSSNSISGDEIAPVAPQYVHQQFLQRYLEAQKKKMAELRDVSRGRTDTAETDPNDEHTSHQDASLQNPNRPLADQNSMFPNENRSDAKEQSYENQTEEFYYQKCEELNRRNMEEEMLRSQNLRERTSREQLADEAELQRALENAQIQADLLQNQIDYGLLWNERDQSYLGPVPSSEGGSNAGVASSSRQDGKLETPIIQRSQSLRSIPSAHWRAPDAGKTKEGEHVSVSYGATSDVVDAYFAETDPDSDDSLRIDDPAKDISDEELEQDTLPTEYASSVQSISEPVSSKRDFHQRVIREMSEIHQPQPPKVPKPVPPSVLKIPIPPSPPHRHNAAVLVAKKKGRALASTLEGWAFNCEVKGIRLYTRELPGRSMPMVRGDGTIALGYGELKAYNCDALLGTDILAVIRSAAARKVWDDRFERSRQVEYLSDNDILIASEMKGKFTTSARDFSCVLSTVADPDTSELWSFGCSVIDPLIPVISKRVRAQLDLAAWHIVPIGPNSFTVTYVVQVDYKASKETPLCVGRIESFLGSYGFPPYVLAIQTNRDDGTIGIKQIGEAYYHKPRVYEHCFESAFSGNGDAEVRYRLSINMYENGAEVSVTGPGRLAALSPSDMPEFGDCTHGFRVVTLGVGLISVRVSPREGGSGFAVVSKGRKLPTILVPRKAEADHEPTSCSLPSSSSGKPEEDVNIRTTEPSSISTPPTPVPSSRNSPDVRGGSEQLSKARSVTRVRSQTEPPRERPTQSKVRFAVQDYRDQPSVESTFPQSQLAGESINRRTSTRSVRPVVPPPNSNSNTNSVPGENLVRQLIEFVLSLNLDGSQLVFVAFASFASFYLGVFYQRYFV